MRLSEAILLGSTLLRPVAGDLELPDDRGALGMAERAVGAGWSYWPWLLTMRVATRFHNVFGNLVVGSGVALRKRKSTVSFCQGGECARSV